MNEIQIVKLNKKEQALFDAICWDLGELGRKDYQDRDYQDRIECLEKLGQLAESLLKREAIPKVRVDWFASRKINAGGYGKSRKEVFERNGTTGRDILRHPHFMEYLRYFMNGPDLPKSTIRGLCKIIEEDRGTSGMVLNQIRAYVRKEVREKKLNPGYAADEFFKLAHEIGEPTLAASVRAAAKSANR
jgi:hypothetical protein